MNKFFCVKCRQWHETDEPAIDHAPDLPEDEKDSLCDDCHKKFTAWFSGLDEEAINRIEAEYKRQGGKGSLPRSYS